MPEIREEEKDPGVGGMGGGVEVACSNPRIVLYRYS